MDEKVYPLMFHHEYAGEKLLGSCFAIKNKRTYVTAAHCLHDVQEYSRVHIGISSEIEKTPNLPDMRTVRKALRIARHKEFDIAVIRVQDEWCNAPLSEPFFHTIYDVGNCNGEMVTFRGYTDDRLGDNRNVVGRTKKGTITQDFRSANNSQPLIELAAHVEHKNSGGPVVYDEMNTGTPMAIIVTLKGTSNSNREDIHGEALLLQPFKADLKLAADDNFSSLSEKWELLL